MLLKSHVDRHRWIPWIHTNWWSNCEFCAFFSPSINLDKLHRTLIDDHWAARGSEMGHTDRLSRYVPQFLEPPLQVACLKVHSAAVDLGWKFSPPLWATVELWQLVIPSARRGLIGIGSKIYHQNSSNTTRIPATVASFLFIPWSSPQMLAFPWCSCGACNKAWGRSKLLSFGRSHRFSQKQHPIGHRHGGTFKLWFFL